MWPPATTESGCPWLRICGRAIACWLFVQSAVACGPGPIEQEVVCRYHEIVAGGQTADYLGLSEAQANAVVFLSFSERASEFERCTGTLVGEGLVLTAKHCAHDRVNLDVEVRFGNSSTAAEFVVDGAVLGSHPSLDLMLIEFETPEDLPRFAEPVPPLVEEVNEARLGPAAQIGGFGMTEDFQSGNRLFAAVALDQVGEQVILVNGNGVSGACTGDSGGPLLARSSSGQVSLLGTLSLGSGDCRGVDEYVRVDSVLEWPLLREAVGDILPGTGCGEISGEGRCYGRLSVWCDEGEVQGLPCENELHCGWSEPTNGYRCVSEGQDVCGGVSNLGRCSGATLTQCVQGQLTTTDCGLCQVTCGLNPRSGAESCVNIAADSE